MRGAVPTACAVGYLLSPLCDLGIMFMRASFPQLARRPIFFRHCLAWGWVFMRAPFPTAHAAAHLLSPLPWLGIRD